MREEGYTLVGRNPVMEAFRAKKTIDRLFVQDGLKDGPILSILREAKKQDTVVDFVKKSRLDEISGGEVHQGVIAYLAAFSYAELPELLLLAKEKGEAPFFFLLDGIEDPHNLGDDSYGKSLRRARSHYS